MSINRTKANHFSLFYCPCTLQSWYYFQPRPSSGYDGLVEQSLLRLPKLITIITITVAAAAAAAVVVVES